ncbi:MAG: Lipopolysaccharide biosynthesis protein rfbH [Ignavibacteria bacterium]|nr:Lipopolysaccharide biosynthesis protein rfbH [Ignavibacteria bacterium]
MAQEEALRKEILHLVKDYYKEKYGNQEFIPGTSQVRYAGRYFDEHELVNLVDASLDFWLTAGRYSEEFEYKFAKYFGLSNAILVNSGSSANLVAMTTLTSPKLAERQLLPGDEVITTACAFPTTIAPIVQNRLVPVFVDVDLATYGAKVDEIKQAISPKTKAIFIAHTLANPYDLNSVMAIARENNLWVIEDNCDALGSRYDGKLTGTFGDLATVSFYPAHHITMGEGGCVITNDDLLAQIARSFRDWGRDCYCSGGENNTCGKRYTQQYGTLPYGYDHKYVYSHIGYNLKVTDMQAAIGVAQLKKLNEFTSKRKRNFNILTEGLKDFEDKLILPQATELSDPSWFGFVITVRENAGFTRNELTSFLEANKVETRNLFAGNILRHPAFMDIEKRVIGNLENTDLITNNTFFIGVYPGLELEHRNYVIEMFKNFFEKS